MKALEMDDLRAATSALFVKETFDAWLIREAQIITFNTFTIDGHIRQGYYSEEELEEKQVEEFSYWRQIKPFCYELMKGKKLPESFHITLQPAPDEEAVFLSQAGTDLKEEDISGLYLNFRYENSKLRVVTGTSAVVFLPDRRLDQAWDEYAEDYLKEQGLFFTEE